MGNTLGGLVLVGNDATVGGTSSGAGNVISANGFGIGAGGSGELIQGNRIGTDPTGTLPEPNTSAGIRIDGMGDTAGGTAAGAGNVISGNQGYGVTVNGASALIQGNLIGTDVTGVNGLGDGAGGIQINVPGSILDNVISSTGGYGIDAADSDLIQGNHIGTDVTGTKALPNRFDGIFSGGGHDTIGGAAAGQGNVISGNGRSGIALSSELTGFNVIQGNLIGVDASGTKAIPNGGDGIYDIDESDNTIGGTTPGAGNILSGNAAKGSS